VKAIEIFRAGTHTTTAGSTLSFSESDLAAIAAAYDPARHEAPIVVGHPKLDAPAYGWIGGLRVENGRLVAEPRQLDPAFAEMVEAGRFKKVSAAFYSPTSPGNPTPGSYHLKHLGFLGAQPPAVKGLRQIEFSEVEGVEVVEFGDWWAWSTVSRLLRGLREWLITGSGQEVADRVLPNDQITSLEEQAARELMQPDQPMPAFAEAQRLVAEVQRQAEADAQRRATELAEREQRLAAREAEFAERDAATRRAEDVALVDRLVGEGRLLPANRASVLAFMAHLDPATEVQFAEGEPASTQRAAFRSLLEAAPRLVEFGEVAGSAGIVVSNPDDPQAIARAADEYQEAQRKRGVTISNSEAIRAVAGGKR